MRLSAQLREATYKVDAAARAEANKVWDSIIAHVKSQADSDFQWLAKDRQSGGVIVHSIHTKLPTNMKVILAPDMPDAGRFAPMRSGGFVIVIGDVLKGNGNTEDLNLRVTAPRLRKTFVHEYTHAMDQWRNPVLFKTGSKAARQFKSGNQSAYAQNPVEFNALYQGVAQEIETRINGKITAMKATAGKRRVHHYAEETLKNLQDEFASFKTFLKMVQIHSVDAPEILKMMKGSKWKRKWLKRMYTLYVGLKPKVNGISLDKRHGLRQES